MGGMLPAGALLRSAAAAIAVAHVLARLAGLLPLRYKQ